MDVDIIVVEPLTLACPNRLDIRDEDGGIILDIIVLDPLEFDKPNKLDG
jgi:hypothetical protein